MDRNTQKCSPARRFTAQTNFQSHPDSALHGSAISMRQPKRAFALIEGLQ